MESWIAKAVGEMHIHKITNIQLANHMGVTAQYVSAILNEKKKPKHAEEKVMLAIKEMSVQ